MLNPQGASYAGLGLTLMKFGGAEFRRWSRIVAVMAAVSLCPLAAGEESLKSLVQRAFALHEKGQYSEALPLLRRAYRLNARDYFVNLLLGIDLLRRGEAKDSVPYLRAASRLRPKEEFPLAYLGEALARQELYGDASEAYLRALQVAPNSSEASVAFVDFAVARFSRMSDRLRSSRKGLAAEYRLQALALPAADAGRKPLLERSASLDPEAPGIWTDLARVSLVGGDLPSAKRYLHDALELDANDLAALVLDAELAARRGEWPHVVERLNAVGQDSRSLLERASRVWPAEVQPPSSAKVSGVAAKFLECVRVKAEHCELASSPAGRDSRSQQSAHKRRMWEEFVKPTATPPGSPEAWVRKQAALGSLNDCRRIIPTLEWSRPERSPEPYGMFLLSVCYSLQAGATAEQARKSGADDAVLHMMQGDILLRLQSNADAAVAEYQAALAGRRGDPAVLERLAEAQLGAGKNDVARENAMAALQIDPQRISAKRTLAKLAMQERDYGAAVPYLWEILARDSGDVTARVELGKALAQTGASDEALQYLAPALEHGYPDEKGSLHQILGVVLKKLGRAAEAEKAFATAQELSEAFQNKSYRDQDRLSQDDNGQK